MIIDGFCEVFKPNYIQTLITIFITNGITLFGVWLAHKGNRKNLKIEYELKERERKIIRFQEKQEEFFLEAKNYFHSLITFYFNHILILQNEMNMEEASNLITKHLSENKSKVDPNKVFLLIGLYFPELKPNFEMILSKRDELNEIYSNYKRDCVDGIVSNNEYKKNFYYKHSLLIRLTEDFEKLILNIKVEKLV